MKVDSFRINNRGFFHNKRMEQTFNSLIGNNFGLPNFEAELATA